MRTRHTRGRRRPRKRAIRDSETSVTETKVRDVLDTRFRGYGSFLWSLRLIENRIGNCFCRTDTPMQAYAAFACTLSQNSARRSASRSVAGLASWEAISATSVRSIGAKPSLAVNTR